MKFCEQCKEYYPAGLLHIHTPKLSRQRKYQKRMRVEGRCETCGRKSAPYASCIHHRLIRYLRLLWKSPGYPSAKQMNTIRNLIAQVKEA